MLLGLVDRCIGDDSDPLSWASDTLLTCILRASIISWFGHSIANFRGIIPSD
jgi:hypothetical protein